MEVNLTNKTENEIYLRVGNEIEKTSLIREKKQTIHLKEAKKVLFEIIHKKEEEQAEEYIHYYEIMESCSIEIDMDGIFQMKDDKKINLNKLNKEEYSKAIENSEPKRTKIQTIHQQKQFHYNHDQLKKDEYVFLDNNKLCVYIFKGLKYSNENKIEALLVKKDSLEEINVNCLTSKIINKAKIKLIVVHCDDIIIERHIVININKKIDQIYSIIQEKLESLVIGKSFRLVFKNTDISAKPLDKKTFRDVNRDNEGENLKEEEEEKKEDEDGEESCSDEESIESCERECEESQEKEGEDEADEEEAEKTESIGEIEKSEGEKSKEEEEKENKLEESKSETESNNKSKTLLSKKSNSSLKKQEVKIGEKSLVDLDYNFEKDYLCIIPPENNFKVFNLTAAAKDSLSSDYYSKSEYHNTFIFSKDIIMKNICITWYNTGNPCPRYPDFDFMIYEMDIDPIEKVKDIETYGNKDQETEFKDLQSVWTEKKKGTYKLLFEKKKIRYDNCGEDVELKKTCGTGFCIQTNEIKMFANKIYCFLFKFGNNPDYCDYNYFYYTNQRFKIEGGGEEDLIIYGHAQSDYYFILGFNYKLNINSGY